MCPKLWRLLSDGVGVDILVRLGVQGTDYDIRIIALAFLSTIR